jgi:hypothetical protein
MIKISHILFLLLLTSFLVPSFSPNDPPDKLQYKFGRPTTKGINDYIKTFEYDLIMEFKEFIKDTILLVNDVWIESDNLSEYTEHDSLELGRFYIPNDIIITNEEMFLDYDVDMMSKWKKATYVETNQFVKATVMHELTHFYFYLVILRMKQFKRPVMPEYKTGINLLPNNSLGLEFIEEGVCEYVTIRMGETVPYKNDYKPTSTKEIVEKRNTHNIKYKHSYFFVKSLLDTAGLQRGIEILISNPPPSTEEILHPEKFYERLKYDFTGE